MGVTGPVATLKYLSLEYMKKLKVNGHHHSSLLYLQGRTPVPIK
jgi:hypothetical protein